MKPKHLMAAELMMSYPMATVAEMLGIQHKTLRNWCRQKQFQDELTQRQCEQAASTKYMSIQAAMHAAQLLVQTSSTPKGCDAKTALEVVMKVCSNFTVDNASLDDINLFMQKLTESVNQNQQELKEGENE